MKITKEKLNQIIQEELTALAEEDPAIAAALKGPAGLPRSAQDTKPDKPITPKDLGPEDEPERDTHDIDIGDSGPGPDEIQAAKKMIKLTPPKKKSDNVVIYNVATYLKNHNNKIDKDTLNKLIAQSRAEAENIRFNYSLNEGYEHEGSMARSQLGRTAELATMIQGMISDDTNLEEWVESKITKAQDYLSSVLNYMRGESLSEAQYEGDEPEENYALEKIQDGLLYFVPGYDLNKDMEVKVRKELIPELIKKIRAAMEEKQKK